MTVGNDGNNTGSLFFISTRYLDGVNLLTQTKVYQSMLTADKGSWDADYPRLRRQIAKKREMATE